MKVRQVTDHNEEFHEGLDHNEEFHEGLPHARPLGEGRRILTDAKSLDMPYRGISLGHEMLATHCNLV